MASSNALRFGELVATVQQAFLSQRMKLPALDAQAVDKFHLAGIISQAEIKELETLIRRDPAAAAGLLQLAASPAFRRSGAPVNISDTIVRLGRKELYGVMAATAMRNLLSQENQRLYALFADSWRALHHHAVTCAFTCGWLADKRVWATYDTGFMGGMFHDVGRVMVQHVLGQLVLDGHLDLEANRPSFAAVAEHLNPTLGLACLQQWRLPEELLAVVQSSHQVMSAMMASGHMALAIRLVASLDAAQRQWQPADLFEGRVDECRVALALTPSDVDELRDKVQGYSEQVAIMLAGAYAQDSSYSET